MGAYVEERFEGGFLLDEGKLRKIVDIIETRTGESSSKFKVFRGDSYSYETSSVDDVVNEDNEDWRAITRLQIKLSDENPLEFMLTFSGRGMSIYITGEDRDTVYLLFSEIREYAKNDVLQLAPMSANTGRIVSLLFMTAVTAFVMYSIFEPQINKDLSMAQAALESSDTNTKLDYLISDRELISKGKSSLYWILILLFLPIIVSTEILQKFWNFIYPSNQFLFGERKKKYESRMSLFSRIFWGVIVALVVSVIASIMVWKVTT